MPKVNYDWVRAQFVSAGVQQGVGDTVLKLLAVWEDVDVPENMLEDSIEFFSKVALQHSLNNTPVEETWVQAHSGGNSIVGGTVRVRHNYFAGEAGILHNGRKGRVTAVRSGDVIVRSTDDLEPFLDNVHYPFEALEIRVR